MKNGQKYAKEINRMVNQEYFECSLWNIRNGKRASEDCRHIPESFDPVSGRDEFCKKCLCESLEWLNEEYKDPKHILNEQEKEIVRIMCDLANKCDRYVIYVSKFIDEFKGVYIYFKLDNADFIETPWLPKNMFKGMDDNIRYKPEELGLENVNG